MTNYNPKDVNVLKVEFTYLNRHRYTKYFSTAEKLFAYMTEIKEQTGYEPEYLIK